MYHYREKYSLKMVKYCQIPEIFQKLYTAIKFEIFNYSKWQN